MDYSNYTNGNDNCCVCIYGEKCIGGCIDDFKLAPKGVIIKDILDGKWRYNHDYMKKVLKEKYNYDYNKEIPMKQYEKIKVENAEGFICDIMINTKEFYAQLSDKDETDYIMKFNFSDYGTKVIPI